MFRGRLEQQFTAQLNSKHQTCILLLCVERTDHQVADTNTQGSQQTGRINPAETQEHTPIPQDTNQVTSYHTFLTHRKYYICSQYRFNITQ